MCSTCGNILKICNGYTNDDDDVTIGQPARLIVRNFVAVLRPLLLV